MSFGRAPRWLVRLFAWTAVAAVILFAGLHLRRSADGKTIGQQLARYGPAADQRLMPAFAHWNVPYPPTRLAFIGFKEEHVLEVWAAEKDNAYSFIKVYPILAVSGSPGPKLREGDGQTPEGLYRIESLNPNSLYHLSLRVSYPNDFDRRIAQRERRKNLGGDIMIHGGAASIGCLAMGDEAAEDLFVLAARTGIKNIVVILSPIDFRSRDLPKQVPQPAWVESLYTDIKKALAAFPVPLVTTS